VILRGGLRAQGADGGGFLLVVVGVIDEVEASPGQDVEAEVVAPFSSFVVLLRQDGPYQADRTGAVGEDTHDVGVPVDLAIETLGLLDQT